MTDLSHNSRSFSSGGADIELSGSNRTFSPNSELLGITSSPLHSQRTGSEEQSDGHIDNFLIGGESTVNGASFNFVNSIVGAGIIGKLLKTFFDFMYQSPVNSYLPL